MGRSCSCGRSKGDGAPECASSNGSARTTPTTILGLFATGIAAALTGEEFLACFGPCAPQRGRGCPSRGPARHFRRHRQSLHQFTVPACAEQRLCRKLGDFTALYEQRFSKRSRDTLDRKRAKLAGGGAPRLWLGRSARRTAAADRYFLRAESPSIGSTGREGHL